MNESNRERVKLVRVDCPPEIFDVEGAYILRRKRVAVWKLDAVIATKPGQEDQAYKLIAELVPQWHGVVDVDTGENLPNPEDDPSVMSKIDVEQFLWLNEALRILPGKLAKSTTNGRT